MTPTLPDLMKALDDLEHIGRKVFQDFTPIWDEDEHTFKRAMAMLHAYVRELNKP